MNRPLVVAAIIEIATGLALVAVPSRVSELRLDEPIVGAGVQVARVAGVALISLGIACWPSTPLVGMLAYGALITLYLLSVAITGVSAGILLWPAIVLHLCLTAALLAGLLRSVRATG